MEKHIFNNIIKRIIAKSQREYSLDNWPGKCMAFNCDQPAIKSHSQTKKFLKKICNIEQEIYTINKDFFKLSKSCFNLEHIKNVSIFKGFCSDHDNKIFALIDAEPQIPISEEEIFLYYFRTLCFEQFQKERELQKTRLMLETFKKDKFFSELQINQSFIFWQNCTLRRIKGMELFLSRDLFYTRQSLNSIFNDFKYQNMNYIIAYCNKLPIHISTMINPLFDDYKPLEIEHQPFVALNVIPYANKSFICFSWLEEHNKHIKKLISGIDNYGFEKIINIMCFLESEDISIQPSFWQSLTKNQKNSISNFIISPHEYQKSNFWNNFPIFIPLQILSMDKFYN